MNIEEIANILNPPKPPKPRGSSYPDYKIELNLLPKDAWAANTHGFVALCEVCDDFVNMGRSNKCLICGSHFNGSITHTFRFKK